MRSDPLGSDPPVVLTGVVGGAGGVAASLDELAACSAELLVLGGALISPRALGDLALIEGMVLADAAWSPLTAGPCLELLAAVEGGGYGLAASALRVEVLGLAVGAAGRAYAATEDGLTRAWGLVDTGRAIVVVAQDATVTGSALAAGVAGGALPVDARLPGVLAGAAQTGLTTRARETERLIDLASGGHVGGLAGALAMAFPDGRARVREVERAPAHREVVTADEAGLAGLGTRLVATNDRPSGTIAVHRITVVGRGAPAGGALPGGLQGGGAPSAGLQVSQARRTLVLVDLPGTDDWSMPWAAGRSTAARDLGGNLRQVGGLDTVYGRGIEQVLTAERAPGGVARGAAPLVLVGHSQGGLAALEVARRSERAGAPVARVITLGSPIAVGAPLRQTPVLSIDNQADLVTAADGRRNPDRANQVSAEIRRQTGTIAGNHAVAGYVEGLRVVDRASVEATRGQPGESGAHVSTRRSPSTVPSSVSSSVASPAPAGASRGPGVLGSVAADRTLAGLRAELVAEGLLLEGGEVVEVESAYWEVSADRGSGSR